jgi:hypothetical protein
MEPYGDITGEAYRTLLVCWSDSGLYTSNAILSIQINGATAALILNALAGSDWSVVQLVLYFSTH